MTSRSSGVPFIIVLLSAASAGVLLSCGGGTTSSSSKSYGGGVSASFNVASGNMNQYGIEASFLVGEIPPYLDGFPPYTCTPGATQGDCCIVQHSPLPDGGADGGPTFSSDGGLLGFYSAGSITVTGASGAAIATLTASVDGLYSVATNPPTATVSWTPGDTLTVTAVGDAVHRFKGTIQTVAAFAGLSPALTPDTSITVARNADWSVRWTPDTQAGEMVTLDVLVTNSAAAPFRIFCSTPDSSGAETISAALLMAAQSGDVVGISMSRAVTTTAADDNATVSLVGVTNVEAMGTIE
jgi:hypothetical protein